MKIEEIRRPWQKKVNQGAVYKHSGSFDYTSSAWRALRARKLQMSPYCECPDCVDMCDHIIPIEQGGEIRENEDLCA